MRAATSETQTVIKPISPKASSVEINILGVNWCQISHIMILTEAGFAFAVDLDLVTHSNFITNACRTFLAK
eukprot:CCRYP_008542-RA/>CCRYP_008542-RA protein AED:0.59 eAED:0.68 QI:0/0/0/1/0/0/2/0/70